MLSEAFTSSGFELSDGELALFERFLDLFVAYNSHTNLSAIREKEAIIEKHFIDSLMILAAHDLSGKILDIGTGGGFPGIPLAIVRPDVHFTLLDSIGKKTRACEHFVHELWLTNVTIINGRAESLALQGGHVRKYSAVLSRATAYLPDILTWSEPFLAKDGVIYLYKSPSVDELKDGEKVVRRKELIPGESFAYTLWGQERQILSYRKEGDR